MFEKFTVKARQVVVASQEEARLLKHGHIGTEHILLGLLDPSDSVAAKVLHQLGYDRETARADVAAVVRPGTEEKSGHIPFSPRAKKTLELALREAVQLHHDYIGTEHILLALLAEGEGAGPKVLAERINPVSRVRAAVLAALEESPGAPGGSWPAGTPATEATEVTVSTASALAGGAPVGSHHLLEAMLRAENSMAARVLRELGVDPAAVAAKIDELDPETTTDANPEETAARRMEIRLTGDEVHLVLRDPATLALARSVTELSGGPIQGAGPVAGLFVPLWRATNQVLQQLRRTVEPESGEEEVSTDDTDAVAKAVRSVLAPRLRRRAG
ncbi:Clp protease N-terminal domain-containing protein [Amycolatopsis sp. PS_44_ISF1]|uniref:Clp protease N-terminal domain-containing protein n=1 Tax=Amycolatopsis sp. PS_44_ISF1 TaxID=2974917 RepID=UPI0028DE7745|nr:Clp protease N-terminal domain-containing protein [Amycolatopsis sp. PS_44_ISF1]MDT8912504.1 Clp protease [Amycolatopsis sp. PS_44_ISF1]